MSEIRQGRVLFIDAARAYAVLLALLTHALHNFGVPDVGNFIYNYPFFTSMATPMFIFMFGVMMEVVYVKKSKITPLAHIDRRFFKRSYQCYLAYLLTGFAALVGGHLDLRQFISSAFFLQNSRYGNILFIYCVVLLFMPLVLRLRLGFGRIAILGLMLAISIFHTLHVADTQSTNYGSLGYVANRFLGTGEVAGGPSAILGLLFALFGMLAGSFFSANSPRFARYAFTGASVIILLSLFVVNKDVGSVEKVKDVLSSYAYGHFRSSNSLDYFLLGSFYSICTFVLIKALVDSSMLVQRLAELFLPLATYSLLAFSFGNIFLNLLAEVMAPLGSTLCLTIFFVSVYFFTKYHKFLPFYGIFHGAFNLQLFNQRKAIKNTTTEG